jgi:putative transposase
MAAVHELTPALGAGAACRAVGLWRGALARQRAQARRAAFVGPVLPRPPRPRPPLALDAVEHQLVLDTLNTERYCQASLCNYIYSESAC